MSQLDIKVLPLRGRQLRTLSDLELLRIYQDLQDIYFHQQLKNWFCY